MTLQARSNPQARSKPRKVGAKTSPLPESYFELVRRFPLTAIRDESHLVTAQELMNELMDQSLDAGGEAYLAALAELTGVHEDKHYPMERDAPASDVLAYFMVDRQLTQVELSAETGISQSTISAVLNGNRLPTRDVASKLVMFFGLQSSMFLKT